MLVFEDSAIWFAGGDGSAQLGIWDLRGHEFESVRWAIEDLSSVLWTEVAGYRSNLGNAHSDLSGWITESGLTGTLW